jgi:hypothetical protein
MRADPEIGAAGIALAIEPRMTSLAYETTLLVPRRPIERPRAQRLTTQFAPEKHTRWPWIALAFIWGLAAAHSFDNARMTRSLELTSTAQSLLGNAR